MYVCLWPVTPRIWGVTKVGASFSGSEKYKKKTKKEKENRKKIVNYLFIGVRKRHRFNTKGSACFAVPGYQSTP